MERDKLGVRVQWVPDRRREGMLRDAAPEKGRWSDPQSHVGDSRFGWRIIGVHGGGVRVALSFLVEGQQRHVRCLDGPLLNPRDSKNPFITAKTLKNLS